jgi:hypothetical protein
MTEIQNEFMTFEFLIFEIVSYFEFRASDFKINLLIFTINSSQIVAQNFMSAAAVEEEFGIPPKSLNRIFTAEGVPTIDPHGLFYGIHAHLGGMILG